MKKLLLTLTTLILVSNLFAQKNQFNFNNTVQSIYKANILKDLSPLPIAETTKNAIVNRFIMMAKENFNPVKYYDIDESTLHDKMKKIMKLAYNEFNDSTKYYWTIETQMKNAKAMISAVGILGANSSVMDSVSSCFNNKLLNMHPNGIQHLNKLQKDRLYHDISKNCIAKYLDKVDIQLTWEPIVVDQYKATIHKQLKEEIPTLTYDQTKELTVFIVSRMIKNYPKGIPSELAGSQKLLDVYAKLIIEWIDQQK